MNLSEVLEAIGDAFGKDITEVIRCRDCKYFNLRMMKYGDCTLPLWRGAYTPDVTAGDYCAWAERREE